MSFVEVADLTKRYAGRPVVDAVSFAHEESGLLSLLGPSGSGKTTVLRMIAGLTQPDAGTIRIGGDVVFDRARSVPVETRKLGMVFQDFALWPHMRVAENVAFPLAMRRVPRSDIRQRVGEVLALVELTGFEDRFPNQLSGGQQQRVALARALAGRPRLLLLDEPLSSLDTGLREQMREELVRIVRLAGITVVNVTHDQDEALAISDRIVLLRDGRIEQAGAPIDLYRHPVSAFAASFMGPANVIPSSRLVELNGHLGVEVRDGTAVVCRPEDVLVRFDAASQDDGWIEGSVVSASFRAGRFMVRLRAGELEVLVAQGHSVALGARAWFRLPPDACHPVPAT